MTYKRATVVMLPTNQKAQIQLGVNLTANIPGYFRGQYFNLYFLSDEEIKEVPCWAINKNLDTIYEVQTLEGSKNWKKIIATTNTSLKITGECKIRSGRNVEIYPTESNFPQPSQSFIERYIENYNKGNIITEVLVEYEELYLYPDGNLSKISRLAPNAKPVEKLKTDSKNTITIKKVKELWNREEMIANMKLSWDKSLHLHKNWKEYYYSDGKPVGDWNLDKWIEQNL